MFKRIVALLCVAVMLLSFAGCKGENKFAGRFVAGAALSVNPVDSVIAKEVAAKYEMTTITSFAGKDYKTFEYNGKKVLARIEISGNVRILYEYPLDTEIVYDMEATKRSGGYLYFTKRDKGAPYASLCSIYIASASPIQNVIADTPCSNIVLLDTKPSSDKYAYGVIACADKIMVLNLANGSSVDYTPDNIKLFLDMGDKFFGTTEDGGYVETKLEPLDKDHIMVNIIEKDKAEETVNEWNFTFNPANGVASN